MLTVLGNPKRFCDGITRRSALKAGSLALLPAFFGQQALTAARHCGTTLRVVIHDAERRATMVRRQGKARSVCATIYECLGIDPETIIYDRARRPVTVSQGGRAVRDILT